MLTISAWRNIGSGTSAVRVGRGLVVERVDLSILVVEDSSIQRRIVATTLRKQHYIVHEAVDGVEGLAMARTHKPTLIISDVDMPEMTGLELCRAIRSDPMLGGTPILMLTALNDFGQFKSAFEAGASDYILKPQRGEHELFLHTLTTRIEGLLATRGVGAKANIMVVDDSSALRKLMSQVLDGAGYDVIAVDDGQIAKQLIESKEYLPDLVVTDTDMPNMSGLELIHWMKSAEDSKNISTVLISANHQTDRRRMGAGVGADAFLSKPFSMEGLVVTVEQILTKASMASERAQLSALVGSEVLDAVQKRDLEPKRENMTILFADIVGFTPMCSKFSAAEVIDLLNWFFSLVVKSVELEGGSVNKFIGDAAMAFFPPNKDGEGDAVGSVQAGLRILRGLRAFNQTHELKRHIRIGINKGPVVVGLVGGHERQDYTAIGDHVNRAQRLEGCAPLDSLCVSKAVWTHVESALSNDPRVEWKALGELSLKGLSQPLTAWSIKPLD